MTLLAVVGDAGSTNRLADLQERTRRAERRGAELAAELVRQAEQQLDETEVARALADFVPVWESLTPGDRVRLLRLLVERVDYDGAAERVAVTFHPTRITTLTKTAGETPCRCR